MKRKSTYSGGAGSSDHTTGPDAEGMSVSEKLTEQPDVVQVRGNPEPPKKGGDEEDGPLVKRIRPSPHDRESRGFNLFIGKVGAPRPMDLNPLEPSLDTIPEPTTHTVNGAEVEEKLSIDQFFNAKISTLLKDIDYKESDLVIIDSKTNAGQALEILREKNILAAPVWDEAEKGYNIVDVMDLWIACMSGRRDRADTFFTTPVVEFCNFSHTNPLVTLTLDDPVVKLFKSFSTTTHRVLVIDDSKTSKAKILARISQVDLLRFTLKHFSTLSPVLDSSSAQNIMKTHNVLFIDGESRLYTSLQMLGERRYSGAGVIHRGNNGEHHLVGNLSISDFRAIRQDRMYSVLFEFTVKQFLQEQAKDRGGVDGGDEIGGMESGSPKLLAPVTCYKEEKLKSVMQTLVKEHVHRIFVVDQWDHSDGLITLTDVFGFVMNKCYDNSQSKAEDEEEPKNN